MSESHKLLAQGTSASAASGTRSGSTTPSFGSRPSYGAAWTRQGSSTLLSPLSPPTVLDPSECACGFTRSTPTPGHVEEGCPAGAGSDSPPGGRMRCTYEHYLALTDEHEILAHLEQEETEASANGATTTFIINLSLWVNVVLFVGKVAALFLSGSFSVAASALDSALDLIVQLIIALANRGKNSQDKALFPAGKSRFEPVGIILCAALMLLCSLELVGQSVSALWGGATRGDTPDLVIDRYSLSTIAGVIVIKSVLWLYCQARSGVSDTVAMLAFDHRNDVLSNAVALVAILFVYLSPRLWFMDALGCITISLYIAFNWYGIAAQKVNELVGRVADQEFIDGVADFVNNYHPNVMTLDVIRAYHFGLKFLVELEVILPANMPVRESHRISLALQQAVERMDNVARAFVHVDWKARTIDEHDPLIAGRVRLEKIRRQRALQGGSSADAVSEASVAV